MENLRQTAHLQRFILQNRPDQLVNGNVSVAPSPDVDADAGGVHDLPQRSRIKRNAGFDQQQFHLLSAVDAQTHPVDAGVGHSGKRLAVSGARKTLHRLNASGYGLLDSLRPGDQIEHMKGRVAQQDGGRDAVAQNLERSVHRLQLLGQRGDARQHVQTTERLWALSR